MMISSVVRENPNHSTATGMKEIDGIERSTSKLAIEYVHARFETPIDAPNANPNALAMIHPARAIEVVCQACARSGPSNNRSLMAIRVALLGAMLSNWDPSVRAKSSHS